MIKRKNSNQISIFEFLRQHPGFAMERIHFSTSPRTNELTAIAMAKPKNLLCSFALWDGFTGKKKGERRERNLKDDLIDKIGYYPDSIILDSGAPTFHNNLKSSINGKKLGRNDITDVQLDLLFEMYAEQFDYEDKAAAVAQQILHDMYQLDIYSSYGPEEDEMDSFVIERELLTPFHLFYRYYQANKAYISHTINLDTIGDSTLSRMAYEVLTHLGVKPIPVFGYKDDFSELRWYVEEGIRYIALGGTAFGIVPKERVRWANLVAETYPEVKFHLLGTIDGYIISRIKENIYSVDGTGWHLSATFQKNRLQGESIPEAAARNIQRISGYLQPVEGEVIPTPAKTTQRIA